MYLCSQSVLLMLCSLVFRRTSASVPFSVSPHPVTVINSPGFNSSSDRDNPSAMVSGRQMGITLFVNTAGTESFTRAKSESNTSGL